MAPIRVFHNTTQRTRPEGFQDGDTVVEVHCLPHDPTVSEGTESQRVEALFSPSALGDGCGDAHAVRYQRRGNRPLRDGDVIAVGDVFHTRTATGWQRLSGVWLAITFSGSEGSRPLRWPLIRWGLSRPLLVLPAVVTVVFVALGVQNPIVWALHGLSIGLAIAVDVLRLR